MKDVVIVMHEALQGAGGKFTQSAVGDMVNANWFNESSSIMCSKY